MPELDNSADDSQEETQDEVTEEETPAPEFDGEYDEDRAKRAIAAIRGDRDKARKSRDAEKQRADELATRLKKLEDAQKSDEQKQAEELERLRKASTRLESLERERKLERAIIAEAKDLGITDFDLTLRALDEDEIEWDDNGEPQNVSDALKALIKRHPALADKSSKGKKKTDAKAGSNDAGAPKLSAEQLEAASMLKMSPEEYLRYTDETLGKKVLAQVTSGKKGDS